MATLNINKLQRQNNTKIFSYIDGLSVNSAAERGEDLDVDSPIEQILYDWADNVVKDLEASWIKKGFNPASTTHKAEPNVIDRAGVLKVLQLTMPDSWYWAENGRKPTKNGHVEGTPYLWQHLERWITYRGIDVKNVKNWQTKRVNKDGEVKIVKPYKNLTSTLAMREVMARAIARSIHKKGTIKRFGYKGSKFFSSVVNQKTLNKLAKELSVAVGYTISVGIAKSI